MSASSSTPDVLIAGAGIIGLSLALELQARGMRVAVLDSAGALRQASFAAAGMLAANDPHNPADLQPLAQLSASLYPAYLERIGGLSGPAVPFQTETVVQYGADGDTHHFAEHSIDPRQLAESLLAAVRHSGVDLYEHAGQWDLSTSNRDTLHLRTRSGVEFYPAQLVHATGAWFQDRHMVTPRKGQMLRVALPAWLRMTEVHRRHDVYIVPRVHGSHAGTAIIGATEEDAGYDTATDARDLDRLRGLAAELVPALASPVDAPVLEAWAGLRPATPDGLPLLGKLSQSQFVATGHYRNGILLAPATAVVMADVLAGNTPTVDLKPFAPQRFPIVV